MYPLEELNQYGWRHRIPSGFCWGFNCNFNKIAENQQPEIGGGASGSPEAAVGMHNAPAVFVLLSLAN